MKPEKSIFLMLGILFLGVIISIFLIFLNSNIPVILMLALGVIYTIIIDLILLYKKPKKKLPKIQPKPKENLDYFYNDLLKNSIELNEKMSKIDKREKQLKKIAEDAKKTMKLANIKKQIKYIKPQRKYIASVLSNKFHPKQCKFTKLISNKNKIYFTTKTQALKQGFKPCIELKR